MTQASFANKVKEILQEDDNVIGLAVGGSWLTGQLDQYSDLDLVIVTESKVSDDRKKMFGYAEKIGNFLSGFTGEHVGEPRLLVCLYDNPLLHVDLKFVTIHEFATRIEDPAILLDKNERLHTVLQNTRPQFPAPDLQWIEDRFWTWVHYILTKIGRGEYFDALDSFSILRMLVLAPLLHLKHNSMPRGVRRVEQALNETDLNYLKQTIPVYNKASLLSCLHNAVDLYRQLRNELFNNNIVLKKETEIRVMEYFKEIEKED